MIRVWTDLEKTQPWFYSQWPQSAPEYKAEDVESSSQLCQWTLHVHQQLLSFSQPQFSHLYNKEFVLNQGFCGGQNPRMTSENSHPLLYMPVSVGGMYACDGISLPWVS